jgi:putative ABC transport system substrate-binding protein
MVGRILILVLTLLSAAGAVPAEPAGPADRVGMLLYDGAPPGFLETFRDEPGHTPQIPAMERASSELGLKLQSLRVHGSGDFPAAFQAAARARAEAFFVLDDTTFTRHRGEILKLARTHRMPIVSRYRDRILKGTKPSALPIEEPAEFDLVVNLRTARALGLKIPPSVLLITTHVID